MDNLMTHFKRRKRLEKNTMEAERNLYNKILSHLTKFGINHQVDIFQLFKNSFSKPTEIYQVYYKMRGTTYINDFLKGMQDNGHISFTKIEEYETVNGTISWEDKFPVLASITSKGYEFIKQQQHINKTRNIAIVAICVSLLSAGFTGYKILLPNNQQSKVQDFQPKQELPKPSSIGQIYHPPNTPKNQQQPTMTQKKN